MHSPTEPGTDVGTQAGAGTESAADSAADSADFWERHYARLDAAWGTRPNAVVREVVTALAPRPGTALDLGCGHGGDALWLAARGWDVTAVDGAATALDRVARGARAAGVADRVHPVRHDLAQTFPPGRFDLVGAAYFHTPLDLPRAAVLRRAAEAVAPRGLLLVVEHASLAPWMWQSEDEVHFPTPEESLASLRLDDGWHVERCEAPRRTATGPQGQTATVTDNVLALRRAA